MQWQDVDADGPPIAEEDVPQQLSFRAQTGGRVTPPNTDDDLGQHLSADHRDGRGPAREACRQLATGTPGGAVGPNFEPGVEFWALRLDDLDPRQSLIGSFVAAT